MFLLVARLPRSNSSSTRQTASSTGRIAKACESCGAIWMARRSKPSWIRARATHARAPDATKWCVGIAVDAPGGKFYWTQKGNDNAGQGRIFRANLEIPQRQTPANRADIEVLYDHLPEPIDLDLDFANRMMYWTDRGDPPRGNTVNRAPMDGAQGTSTLPEIVFSNLMEAIGLALDLKGRRMFMTDLAGSVYSANLDGSNQKTLLFAQGNLSGIAYAELPSSAS